MPERGLAGVRLVISDAQRGIVEAVHGQLLGAAWQRCCVHATCDALVLAAAIRSIFEQPDEPSAAAQLRRVWDGLSARFPAVGELLTDAEADLLVHFTFPEAHRRQIRSTNPQERLNKEIPVLDWCAPEGPRRRLLGWVSVPGPDSKEISGATSI